MRRIVTMLCIMLMLFGAGNVANAYTANITYYLDGLDVDTGAIYTDPTVFLILPEDTLETMLQPPANILPTFDPAVDVFVEYNPMIDLASLVVLPKTVDDPTRIVSVTFGNQTFPVSDFMTELIRINFAGEGLFTFNTAANQTHKVWVKAEWTESVEPPVVTPEPGTLALLGLGLVGVLGALRRKAKRGALLLAAILLSGLLLVNFAGMPVAQAQTAGEFAYIANSGNGSGNTVSVIALSTNTVVDTITVGTQPYAVAVNPVLPRVYVANYGSHNVSVINTHDNSVIATIAIPSVIPGVGSYPTSMAVNPAGTRLYVVNSAYVDPTTNNVLTVIDTSDNQVLTQIPVGIQPCGVAVSPDGTRVYVSNRVSKTVSVIDASANNVTATIALNKAAWYLAVTPDGTRLYVTSGYTNGNGGVISNETVTVIDTSTNNVEATITTGLQAWAVVVNPAGTLAYVSNAASATVSVIDVSTNHVVATLPMESAPLGMSFNADGTRLYVANGGSDNVKVVDISTHTVIASVPVGDAPYSMGQFIRPAAVRSLCADITADTARYEVNYYAQNSFAGLWFDYDNDSDLDFMITPGESGQQAALCRNNGDNTFSDVTAAAGLNAPFYDYSLAVGDYDNDGDTDLLGNSLYRNDSGVFTEIPGVWGAFVDYDNDGDLDAIGCGWGEPCDVRKNDNGTFTAVPSGSYGLTNYSRHTRSTNWADYDNDGDMDLLIVNGRGEPVTLYRNDIANGGGFMDVTTAMGLAQASVTGRYASGAAWGDYDNDGDVDLFVTDVYSNGNRLYRNDGSTFTDVTASVGLPNNSGGLHATWADYDNDGKLDLYVATKEVFYTGGNKLFRNTGAGFVLTTEMTDTEVSARVRNGGSWGDVNGDGFPDHLVTGGGAKPVLYRNQHSGNGNHWLHINLVGVASNQSGVGATVYVTAGGQTQMRHVTSYDGHSSQNSLPLMFGLGQHDVIDAVVIKWPSGLEQTLINLMADRKITITEGMNDYFMHEDPAHLGATHDADKTGNNDSNKCHSAGTSNILDWSGFDQPPTYDTEQQIFGYFQTNWEDKGSLVRYVARCWIDGTLPPPFGTDWATATACPGYFATGTFAGAYLSHWTQTNLIETIKSYLHSGYGTTLALYDNTASNALGHVLTVWGYRYANATDEIALRNVIGLWVTDSDDATTEPPQEWLLPVAYGTGSGDELKWRVTTDSPHYANWLIEGVEALKPLTATQPATELPRLAIVRKKCVGDCFNLTDASIQNLRADGISESVLDKLLSLKNQEFCPEGNFLQQVEVQIGVTNTATYKTQLLNRAAVLDQNGKAVYREITCPANDNVTVYIGDKACDDECKRMTVAFDSNTALQLRLMIDFDPENPVTFKGWEVNGQMWPGGPFTFPGDVFLRPVIGCRHDPN